MLTCGFTIYSNDQVSRFFPADQQLSSAPPRKDIGRKHDDGGVGGHSQPGATAALKIWWEDTQSSDDMLITGMVYRYPPTPAMQGGAGQGRRVWLLQPFGSFLCLHVLLRQWLIHQRLGGLEGLS